jgi:lia operon protein LiaG
MVPASVTLDQIEVVNSNITVTNIQGEVNLRAINGGIEAHGLTGAGTFKTVNGTVRVTYARMPTSGGISLKTVNGSCNLILPGDAAFDLDTDTVNGRVNCDFPITLESSDKRELRGAVNGGGTRVNLESVNGGLAVERAK